MARLAIAALFAMLRRALVTCFSCYFLMLAGQASPSPRQDKHPGEIRPADEELNALIAARQTRFAEEIKR